MKKSAVLKGMENAYYQAHMYYYSYDVVNAFVEFLQLPENNQLLLTYNNCMDANNSATEIINNLNEKFDFANKFITYVKNNVQDEKILHWLDLLPQNNYSDLRYLCGFGWKKAKPCNIPSQTLKFLAFLLDVKEIPIEYQSAIIINSIAETSSTIRFFMQNFIGKWEFNELEDMLIRNKVQYDCNQLVVTQFSNPAIIKSYLDCSLIFFKSYRNANKKIAAIVKLIDEVCHNRKLTQDFKEFLTTNQIVEPTCECKVDNTLLTVFHIVNSFVEALWDDAMSQAVKIPNYKKKYMTDVRNIETKALLNKLIVLTPSVSMYDVCEVMANIDYCNNQEHAFQYYANFLLKMAIINPQIGNIDAISSKLSMDLFIPPDEKLKTYIAYLYGCQDMFKEAFDDVDEQIDFSHAKYDEEIFKSFVPFNVFADVKFSEMFYSIILNREDFEKMQLEAYNFYEEYVVDDDFWGITHGEDCYIGDEDDEDDEDDDDWEY